VTKREGLLDLPPRPGYAPRVDRPAASALDPGIVARITELCERGDDELEAARYDAAIDRYREALALVPHPVRSWGVSTFIHASIAEALYLGGEHASAREAIDEAFRCEGGIGNAFLHLRLGQIEHILGNRGRALDELIRAFTRSGEEVFAGEDPKYLAMVKVALLD
jgi:tetratricopeptide (TPR) repeat protein